jgi:hypothetical protein
MSLSRFGGSATRSLDGADPAGQQIQGIADPSNSTSIEAFP